MCVYNNITHHTYRKHIVCRIWLSMGTRMALYKESTLSTVSNACTPNYTVPCSIKPVNTPYGCTPVGAHCPVIVNPIAIALYEDVRTHTMIPQRKQFLECVCVSQRLLHDMFEIELNVRPMQRRRA